MFIKQLYTGCLSEAAYFIESKGEAAVIDPLRDTDVYLALATERNAKIKYIFETHFHADFVSGHLDLEKSTGASIVYGPGTETGFPILLAKDQQEFKLGDITIQVIHTPGHTLESSCYLLKDDTGKPHAIFTGDTLFVGDVGRPDLSSGNMTSEELAATLYESLRNKLMTLPDDVIVYPAHGAGSSCGKNMGPESFSTIGEQKRTNYALQAQTKEQFVAAVTSGLAEPPQYFPVNAKINREGYESLDRILENGLKPLTVEAFKSAIENESTVLLDTRKGTVFTQGFVPGAINIGLEGRFAEWAGVLLPFDKNILLVTEPGTEKEAIVRLARVGFSKMAGFLQGGFETWTKAGEQIDMVIDIEADELAMDIPHDDRLVVLDVRRETEFGDGHVAGAMNIPLDDFTEIVNIAGFEEDENIYIHCGSGYRSVIAASLLKRQGVHNIRNVLGGFEKIREQPGIEIVKENSVLN
jgi:hydroxyacylglutathione hydrolase